MDMGDSDDYSDDFYSDDFENTVGEDRDDGLDQTVQRQNAGALAQVVNQYQQVLGNLPNSNSQMTNTFINQQKQIQ